MSKTKNIQLNLGHPKNGWIPVKLKFPDFELNFMASNIPEDPIEKLCEVLILTLNGIETELCWNLEPKCYFFKLKPNGNKIHFIVLQNERIKEKHNLIYEFTGDFESVVLPMYRDLKKFDTLEVNKMDWQKINPIKINKLKELVTNLKKHTK